MEKRPRASEKSVPPHVSAKLFSIARSNASDAPPNAVPGLTIQIRLKVSAAESRKLLTRKNTEFWLTANPQAEVE